MLTSIFHSYETSDGQQRLEEGKFEGPDQTLTVSGYYSYTGPDNELYEVYYTADENGYQVSSKKQPKKEEVMFAKAIPVSLPVVVLNSLIGG